MKFKDVCSWNKIFDKHRQHIKKQRHHFVDIGLYSQSYRFSSSHVWMWELDHKEGWASKNWCIRSSDRVLCGSVYSFPLVRYSCPLLAGVVHALLCLTVYSWCIHGERYTPCPPTPPPSCSLQKIDAFELCCWRRLWRVPWTARRSKQPILKEINSEYSLEGLMLKLQYFGHLMWRTDSLKKTLMLGNHEGWRRGQQRMQWLDSITASMDVNLSKLWEIAEDRGAWRAVVHGVTKSRT